MKHTMESLTAEHKAFEANERSRGVLWKDVPGFTEWVLERLWRAENESIPAPNTLGTQSSTEWIEIKEGCRLPEYGEIVTMINSTTLGGPYQETCDWNLAGDWREAKDAGVTYWKPIDWPVCPHKRRAPKVVDSKEEQEARNCPSCGSYFRYIHGKSPNRDCIDEWHSKPSTWRAPKVEEQDGEQEPTGVTAADREKAHWCGTGPYASFSEGAKAVIFSLERQIATLREPSKGLDSLSPKEPTVCPNCGRTDGWHKAEGHPPPPVGDCRKVVWMRDADGMEWWGVRAYGGHERGWNINGREESSTVLFWHDGPHNPFYPPVWLAKGSPSEGTGWISVQQELPPKGVVVLAFSPQQERWGMEDRYFTTRMIDYHGKVEMHWLDFDINRWATHWQPLPAPPVAPPEKEK